MKRNYASVTLYDFIGLTLCYKMTAFSIYVCCLISFFAARRYASALYAMALCLCLSVCHKPEFC